MMFDQDHTEENEQQKLDEARGDDSFEEDSDYFSFGRVRDRALGSEYGGELSRHDKMDDTGTYKFDTGDELNLEEVHRRREKIYTYHYLKDVFDGMELDEVFPHLEDLEKAGVMSNVKRRMGVGGVFLGLDFKKDDAKTYRRIVNRSRDNNGRLTEGFEYSEDGKSADLIRLFKLRLKKAREMYESKPSGMIEAEVRSVLNDDSAWSTATEGSRESEGTGETVQRSPDKDDNQNQDEEDNRPLGNVVRFNRDSEEVSIEQQQENREIANVIEEEVEQANFELIEEVELDLQGVRDKLIARFGKLARDNEIAPFGETDYLVHIGEVLKPISEMEFYKNQEFFTNTDMTADQLYDQQMKYLEDNVKDIDKRIAKEKAKNELLKAYKGLHDCIDLKMDTLNIYFERPAKAEYFRRQMRRIVRRNGRLAFERGKRWV